MSRGRLADVAWDGLAGCGGYFPVNFLKCLWTHSQISMWSNSCLTLYHSINEDGEGLFLLSVSQWWRVFGFDPQEIARVLPLCLLLQSGAQTESIFLRFPNLAWGIRRPAP